MTLVAPVFTKTAPEYEKNKIKKWKISKIHQNSLKTNMFKVITDIRKQLKNVSRFVYNF